jgi:hypothetical protein
MREAVFLRGPGALLRDLSWLAGLLGKLFIKGSSGERLRVVKYLVASWLPVIIVAVLSFDRGVRANEANSLPILLAIPLLFAYGVLLDITRRVRPLNEGKLASACVLKVSHMRGFQSADVRSMGREYVCHYPNVLFRQPIASGETVAIAGHPHDDLIAAIVNATPGAVFADDRRRECAAFIARQQKRSCT